MVEKTTSKKWFFFFLIIWCVQMSTAVYFCCKKQGFHEDEYYTYYSTARTYGLTIEDGAWMERASYFDEFIVLKGQEFQYGLVELVQSWDVHPPFYYWLFHTIASLFPGQFSKWFGLILNLVAFGLSMFLLRLLALQVTKGQEKLSWLVCFFYGFTPAVMSSVVFIRMYALLTVFVLLCAILHVYMIEQYSVVNEANPKLPFFKFLLPLAAVTYLGFLTQYYYFIFLFFMAIFFCLYLFWKERKLWNCIRYGLSVGTALLFAYLTYPACLGQMFRGQRGAQAVGNFFDISNTLTRLVFFWKLLDEYVFGKMLFVFLLVLGGLLIYTIKKGHIPVTKHMKTAAFLEENLAYFLLLFAVAGYFLAVSKTALLLGNTSVRYQIPVYGMMVLLVFAAIEMIWRTCKTKDKNSNLFYIAAVIICLTVNLVGLLSGRVVFLYPEDLERVAYAKEKAVDEIPVVCLYDEGQSWCVWDCADEFFEYDRIYFAGISAETPIEDETIAESDEVIVYLSNAAETKIQLQRILNSNSHIKAYELLWQEKYCDVYHFY